jgi:hypothetical protein
LVRIYSEGREGKAKEERMHNKGKLQSVKNAKKERTN